MSTSQPAPERDLSEILSTAIDDAIEAITATSGSAGTASARSSDDLVTAEVSSNGQLVSLDVDPRTLRGGSERIIASVVEAYNAARDAAPAQDPAERNARREQAKRESQEAMRQLAGALETTLRRVVTDAGGQY